MTGSFCALRRLAGILQIHAATVYGLGNSILFANNRVGYIHYTRLSQMETVSVMFNTSFLPYIFRGHTFTLQGIELDAEDVLTERGLLPVIAHHADETSKWLFQGMGIGMVLVDDEESLIGQRVDFFHSENCGVPDVMRAQFILNSALEVLGVGLEPSPVSLDALMDRLASGEPICAAPGM